MAENRDIMQIIKCDRSKEERRLDIMERISALKKEMHYKGIKSILLFRGK